MGILKSYSTETDYHNNFANLFKEKEWVVNIDAKNDSDRKVYYSSDYKNVYDAMNAIPNGSQETIIKDFTPLSISNITFDSYNMGASSTSDLYDENGIQFGGRSYEDTKGQFRYLKFTATKTGTVTIKGSQKTSTTKFLFIGNKFIGLTKDDNLTTVQNKTGVLCVSNTSGLLDFTFNVTKGQVYYILSIGSIKYITSIMLN